MAVKQYVRAITPKLMPLDAPKVKIKLRQATLRVCNMAAEELNYLVEPWDHKPKAKVKIKVTADEISGTAATEDKAMFMLDGGTRERWAFVSRDWQSKTRGGSLRSGHGRGRVLIRGRSAMQKAGKGPQPGIKKRGFSDKLKDKYEPVFNREIDKVMADAITKGQAIKP